MAMIRVQLVDGVTGVSEQDVPEIPGIASPPLADKVVLFADVDGDIDQDPGGFEYNKTTGQLLIKAGINGLPGDVATNGGDETITGGTANANDGSGGTPSEITAGGGQSAGDGGSVSIAAGFAASGSNRPGGAVATIGGDGDGNNDGGAVSLLSGNAGSGGAGGAITLLGGNGGAEGTHGGNIVLQAGPALANGSFGGDVEIMGGDSPTPGDAGKVLITGREVVTSVPNAAPADGELANGQAVMWVDEVGNNIKIKVKYSNGTVKTFTGALA